MTLSDGVLLTRAKIGIGVAVPLVLLFLASPGLIIFRRRKQRASRTNNDPIVHGEIEDMPAECAAGCRTKLEKSAIHIAASDVLDPVMLKSEPHAPTSFNTADPILVQESGITTRVGQKASTGTKSDKQSPPRRSEFDIPPIAYGILSALSKQASKKQEKAKPVTTSNTFEVPVLGAKTDKEGEDTEDRREMLPKRTG